MGYVHYFCTGAGFLCEANGFVTAEPFDVHIQQGVKHTIQVIFSVLHRNRSIRQNLPNQAILQQLFIPFLFSVAACRIQLAKDDCSPRLCLCCVLLGMGTAILNAQNFRSIKSSAEGKSQWRYTWNPIWRVVSLCFVPSLFS